MGSFETMPDYAAELPRLTAAAMREARRVWRETVDYTRALALVPIRADGTAKTFAQSLLATGLERGAKVKLFDATPLDREAGIALAREITAFAAEGGVPLAVTGPLDAGGAAGPIIEAVSAVVVVVKLGESALEEVRALRDAIGADRVLGCVAVEPG